jgi:anti-anti-sigma factor
MQANGGPVKGPAYQLDRSICVPAGRIAVSGEIDYDCAGTVEDTLMGVVEEQGVRYVVVDLSRLRFMDARCAGILLVAKCRADRRGVAMSVARVTGIPRRVLEVLGLYDELRTCRMYRRDRPPNPSKGS